MHPNTVAKLSIATGHAMQIYNCLGQLGAIHTSELDRSEIDLSPKRSECECSNAN